MREFVFHVYYTRYHLWLFVSILKHGKGSKYYDQNSLNILFLLSTLPMMIPISGENDYLVKKSYFSQKASSK